jgi:hypothetical protein
MLKDIEIEERNTSIEEMFFKQHTSIHSTGVEDQPSIQDKSTGAGQKRPVP